MFENEQVQIGGQVDENDVLRSLGLLDPETGNLVDDPELPPELTPTSQTGKTNWESDDNPYKTKYQEVEKSKPTVGQTLQETHAQLDRWAAEAWEHATKTLNVRGDIATAFIEPQLRAAKAEAELVANRQATLPMARRQAAESIAKEVSDKNLVINADELVDEPSLEAMRTKAKTLAKERRDFRYQGRRAGKVDSAEGGPPTSSSVSEALSKVDSTTKIALGLRRGDVK
jgi:hypothetical protein